MIKIDKGIPTPVGGGKLTPKYPFREMEVGDSFFLPLGVGPEAGTHSLYSSAKLHGIRIRQHKCEEDGVKGYRVWRIADEPKLRAVK